MSDQSNEVEMARMLLWFKAQLPPHTLDEWYITVMPSPSPTVLEDTDTSCSHMAGWRTADAQRVEGYGRCTRCGRQFELAKSGNSIALDLDWVERVVERLKDSARRDAERAGPCWGDVPNISHPSDYAVLDANGAARPIPKGGKS